MDNQNENQQNENLNSLIKKLTSTVFGVSFAIVLMLCMVVASNVGWAFGSMHQHFDFRLCIVLMFFWSMVYGYVAFINTESDSKN